MNRTNYTRIETKNSLPQSIRLQSVGLLNRNLASAIDLERQAKQAHWNVKGPNFIALHELFDKVAEAAAGHSALPSYPVQIGPDREHVDALSTALALFGKAAREAIDEAAQFGDADTADVFTEISRETDKQLWLVESHLHG